MDKKKVTNLKQIHSAVGKIPLVLKPENNPLRLMLCPLGPPTRVEAPPITSEFLVLPSDPFSFISSHLCPFSPVQAGCSLLLLTFP